MRDFLVLIRQTQYDVTTNKILTDYKNINVLVGSQESLDAVKSKVEKFVASVGGSFQSEWRTQAR